MGFSKKRADDLVKAGKSYNEYKCNQTVNEIMFGVKDGKLAKDYLIYGSRIYESRTFRDLPSASRKGELNKGVSETPPLAFAKAGNIIVAKNGSHVAVFDSSNTYIEASASKSLFKTVRRDIGKLGYTFTKEKTNGYYIHAPIDKNEEV